MPTMYELIMDLPLFKGVGNNHVSVFLEKTSIKFDTYNPGEVIISKGEKVSSLRFILKGEVNTIYTVGNESIKISERSSTGRVFGAEHLFGMSTEFPYSVMAVDKVSIMELDKTQYVNLLKSDNIYMLNFFNYLSVRAQRVSGIFQSQSICTPESVIRNLVAAMTDPVALSVMIYADDKTLANYCNASEATITGLKDYFNTSDMAECTPVSIFIPDRSKFISEIQS